LRTGTNHTFTAKFKPSADIDCGNATIKLKFSPGFTASTPDVKVKPNNGTEATFQGTWDAATLTMTIPTSDATLIGPPIQKLKKASLNDLEITTNITTPSIASKYTLEVSIYDSNLPAPFLRD
jgi:hypothetical protein